MLALPQFFFLFFSTKFRHQDLNQAAMMDGLPLKKLFHHTKLLGSTSYKCIYLSSNVCLASTSNLWMTLNFVRLNTYFSRNVSLRNLVVSIGTTSIVCLPAGRSKQEIKDEVQSCAIAIRDLRKSHQGIFRIFQQWLQVIAVQVTAFHSCLGQLIWSWQSTQALKVSIFFFTLSLLCNSKLGTKN